MISHLSREWINVMAMARGEDRSGSSSQQVRMERDADTGPEPLMILASRTLFEKKDIEELDTILWSDIPPGMFPQLLHIVMFKADQASSEANDRLSYSPILLRLLLKNWPEKQLRVSEIGLKESEENPILKRKYQQCLVAILKAFLESLGYLPNTSKLKILDLRGIDLTDMDFLKHYKGLFLDSRVIKTNCQIYLDLNITYSNHYLLWNEILPRVQGVVKIARLSTIFRTGFDSTKLILDALDEHVLTSLAAKHLEMINEEFLRLVGSLSRLQNLSELDLSCGTLRLALARPEDEPNSEAVDGMTMILDSLPKLKRLNLSNNKLGGNLQKFFQSTEFSLVSLELKNCGLLSADLVFMESCCSQVIPDLSHDDDDEVAAAVAARHRFSRLTKLNLADNSFAEAIDPLVTFLGHLEQLQVLSLEECALKESHAKIMCEVTKSSLRHLTSLNLSGHKWSLATLIDSVHALVPRPVLTTLVLPIYGINSLQFKFKAARFHSEGVKRQPLSQVLEPVAGQCSEIEEIAKAVESYRGKRNGFSKMSFKINWLDGLAFTFTKDK